MHSRLPEVLERVAQIRAELRQLKPADARPSTEPERSFQDHLAGATARPSAQAGIEARRTFPPPLVCSSSEINALVQQAALKHRVSADLIHSVIRVESSYNPRCTSSAGAMGLMQLMPGTARGLGVTDPYDPAQSIDGGTRYLREQLDIFDDTRLALAAYNAGPGAVRRYDGVPPYRETQAYVRRVLEYLSERSGQQRTGEVREADG
jgi:soluble lytic murein transglycosylase-like protein